MIKKPNPILFKITFALTLLLADIAVYLLLGLLLMSYDDNYDRSKGEYWSLESMNMQEKVIYFSYCAWHVVNIGLVIYIVYRVYRYFRHTSHHRLGE